MNIISIYKYFSGIDALYEPPENPDVIIDTQDKSVIDFVQLILVKANLT